MAEGKRRFHRMYICFNAMKLGFKEGLRPFIGLDETFLKGHCKGKLLVVVAQDCQNHFYPLAWAVVDKENTLTWTWFLELLKHSLNLKDGTSLLGAVRTALPLSNHRFCVRYIKANWSKRIRISREMKKYLWWSTWSTYEEDFKDQLKSLGELSVDDAKEVLRYPPQNWCRSYFDTLCKNQMVDNNFTESFNSWILEARGKPILKMIEDIRIKVMNILREKEEEARTWGGEFSPNCMKLCDRHTVNLVEKKCTCRFWQLTGIPCPHTIRALKYERGDPMTKISWCYSKEAYLMTYRAKLMPVKGEKFWKVLSEHAMDPPPLAKIVGRPKVKRNREKD
uniref:Uncharacterized protein LOC104222839 n=1 Tax=Nicotiana sylvestris TaxID=4096 RepID=A0A1U7WE08_NICSY|nr:PREDICTED: uncharacterized protein LOC104222839 [Nicotiana sylvestris]